GNRYHYDDCRGRDERRQRLMDCEQQAGRIGVENYVEMLLGDFAEAAEPVIPRIDLQYVEAPRRGLDRLVNAVEVVEVRNIAWNGGGAAADRGNRLVQLGLTTPGDKHARAFLGETLGDAESDPGAAAGHQSDFTR